MIAGFTGLSAVVPSLLLVWFFKSRDVHPEPSKVLWMTFLLGVLSIIPTLIVALPIMLVLGELTSDPLAIGVGQAFLTAALPEELFKLAVVILYASKHEAFDEPMDGIVYGVVASLGFATFENILYSMQGGLGVAAMRAFSAVPMHAACGAVMGYYIGQARFAAKGSAAARGARLKAYVFPVLIHGIYDAPLLWMETLAAKHGDNLPEELAVGVLLAMLIALVALITGVVWALRLVARLRKEQLRLVERGGFVWLESPATPLGPALLEPPSPRASSSSLLGWILIIAGFLIAGFGGLFLLGGLLVLVTQAVPQDELGQTLVGCAILGLPSLAIGVGLFIVGLGKLPKKQRRFVAARA